MVSNNYYLIALLMTMSFLHCSCQDKAASNKVNGGNPDRLSLPSKEISQKYFERWQSRQNSDVTVALKRQFEILTRLQNEQQDTLNKLRFPAESRLTIADAKELLVRSHDLRVPEFNFESRGHALLNFEQLDGLSTTDVMIALSDLFQIWLGRTEYELYVDPANGRRVLFNLFTWIEAIDANANIAMRLFYNSACHSLYRKLLDKESSTNWRTGARQLKLQFSPQALDLKSVWEGEITAKVLTYRTNPRTETFQEIEELLRVHALLPSDKISVANSVEIVRLWKSFINHPNREHLDVEPSYVENRAQVSALLSGFARSVALGEVWKVVAAGPFKNNGEQAGVDCDFIHLSFLATYCQVEYIRSNELVQLLQLPNNKIICRIFYDE